MWLLTQTEGRPSMSSLSRSTAVLVRVPHEKHLLKAGNRHPLHFEGRDQGTPGKRDDGDLLPAAAAFEPRYPRARADARRAGLGGARLVVRIGVVPTLDEVVVRMVHHVV